MAIPLRVVAPALVLAGALAALPAGVGAAVVPGSLEIRAEGRSPIQGGRADVAYQQALDEAMRRALLEALRVVAPERQSPQDLETWQETLLSRAGEHVAAWRVLSFEERDGFLVLEASVEFWREKLARAARTPAALARPQTLRLLVLGDSFPLLDRAAEEEVDAGREAVAALEAELARRGAVIVSSTERSPWEQSGPGTDENRLALASTAGRKLEADAVLVSRLTRSPAGMALTAEVIAVASESTLGSARSPVELGRDVAFAEALAPAAREIAAALAPRLAAIRSSRTRALPP